MKDQCNNCKKYKTVHIRKDGAPICRRCYDQYRQKEICVYCEKLHIVQKRIDNNKPVCKSCYNKYYRPKENCIYCEKLKNVEMRNTNNEAVCKSCYNKFRQKRICSVCKKYGIIYVSRNNILICSECYEQPKNKCSVCGKIDKLKRRLCQKCYKPPTRKCTICKKNKSIAKNIDENICLCHSCYISNRLKNDDKFHLIFNLRWLVQNAFKLYSNGKIQKSNKYNIDYQAIIEYLGPCPGNRKDYHIDHIFPLSAFDLNNPEHIKLAFAPENHQWLTKEENMKKGKNFNEIEFQNYLNKGKK